MLMRKSGLNSPIGWVGGKRQLRKTIAEFKQLLASREIFEVLRSVDTCYLSEVVRAVRFFYLNKNSFGSKGTSFGGGPQRKRLRADRVEETITLASQRLAGVLIERLDFRTFLKRYDDPKTVFYIDPPYVDCPGCYRHELVNRDHQELAEAIRKLRGRFLLSYNDHPLIRKLYRGVNVREVSATYTLSPMTREKVCELLITNF